MVNSESYDAESLAKAASDEQTGEMDRWFRERFEDPANRTPYESAEGGYIWIWGGPYDASEELYSEFDGIVPSGVIEALARELDAECPSWAPTESPGDYDSDLSDAISSNASARQTLDNAIATIRSLLSVDVGDANRDAYIRLLYANVITALETFFSDTFINHVLDDESLLQKYLDTDRSFADRKLRYKDVLREAARVKAEAHRALLETVWHNLGKVKALYAQVFAIDLNDTRELGVAIGKRHHIVHRNGRDRDDNVLAVTAGDVEVLIDAVVDLSYRIDTKLDFGVDVDEFPF